MSEVAKHKNGGSVRYENHEGKKYICCKDLFTMLNIPWSAKKVKRLATQKFKTGDSTGKRRQVQTFLLAEHAERFMQKSGRREKALWLHRTFLAHRQFKSMSKPDPRVAALEAQVRELQLKLGKKDDEKFQQPDTLREEARFILSSNAAGWREFVIRAFDLQEHEHAIMEEDKRWRELDRKRESGEDQKIQEIPADVEPQKWSKDKVYFRWIEYEGDTWVEIEDFCLTMKFAISYCNMGSKPRDFEGPYLAEHRGDMYLNITALKWHRMTIPQYDTGRVAALEHFLA